MKFLKYLFLGLLSFSFFNCSDNEKDDAENIGETRYLFFENEILTIERKEGVSVKTTIRYTGKVLDTDLSVNYKITYPNQNAAIEGDDFELPANSGVINIPAGQSSVTVELIASIFTNTEARDSNRSIYFDLEPINGFTLGKPDDNSGVNTQVIIGLDIDPISSDPNDEIGDKKLSITKNGNAFKIPYYANVTSIDEPNTKITRVVIAQHGQDRNADIYYDRMLAAAQMESTQLDTLLIIAPQFLIENDIASYNLDNEHLYWSEGGWKIGFLSRNEEQNPRLERISSFTMMDSLIARLTRNYTNLKTIVLSGHSAGGQYTNRYAATTPMYDQLESQGIRIHFIVNNPSSYLYLDDKRRVSGTSTYEVPTTSCTQYNEYKYGLEDLPSYLREIGVSKITEQFSKRTVTYLVGARDNNPNSSSLDTSCEAMLQGNHRLERGIFYYDYLKDFYGTVIENTQTMETVPDVGHNSEGMFQSELGRLYAFRK